MIGDKVEEQEGERRKREIIVVQNHYQASGSISGALLEPGMEEWRCLGGSE